METNKSQMVKKIRGEEGGLVEEGKRSSMREKMKRKKKKKEEREETNIRSGRMKIEKKKVPRG